MTFTPQSTVSAAPPVALVGMVADSRSTDTISRQASAACGFGRIVCGDEETCEHPDSAADVTNTALGMVRYDPSKTPAGDPPYAIDDAVPVLQKGPGWAALLSGAAPQHGDAVYVYRGATTADRGKVTQDATASSVTLLAGARFTGKTMSGGAEVEFDCSVGKTAGLVSEYGYLLLSLHDFREVDANSDVGAITANGGILASDTSPSMRGNTAETQEISWAAGNADPIACQKALPGDVDGSYPVEVELWVNSGATDAATMTVESGWDGGALVSDSADDTATKSATTHKVTATIAAADVPDDPAFLTLVLTPAAHATNAIQLQNVRVKYRKKAA